MYWTLLWQKSTKLAPLKRSKSFLRQKNRSWYTKSTRAGTFPSDGCFTLVLNLQETLQVPEEVVSACWWGSFMENYVNEGNMEQKYCHSKGDPFLKCFLLVVQSGLALQGEPVSIECCGTCFQGIQSTGSSASQQNSSGNGQQAYFVRADVARKGHRPLAI